MISIALQKWLIVIFAATMAAPQYPVPYMQQYQPMKIMVPVPPQPPPVQVPVPVPVPIGIVIREESSTQITTTTTAKPQNQMFKIYLPWTPFYWQMPNYPFPKFPPLNISIPLPNCQNLTLKLPPQMPPPMPAPFIMPPHPPVIMIPLPPRIVDVRPKDRSFASGRSSSSSSSSSSSDSSDSSDSDSDSSDRSRSRKKKFDIFRRNHKFSNIRKSFGHIQPVLSYVSENGDVKLRKRLSRKDAADLLHTDTKPARNIIKTGRDSNKKSKVLVAASSKSPSKNLTKKIVMRSSMQQTEDGDKEIVFKTLNNKQITNFSMSFRVER